MPVMINLTTADHGGTSMSCGTHESCGIDCNCGCPYTGMEAKGRVELIAEVERRYPEEWLGFVIPPGEDEFAPERAMLVVHSDSDDEVLGIHIIGPHATELIAEGGLALSHEATAESLMRTIHAHPTLYEALGEAEHAAAEGAAIHV